ncbi:MAG: winged helix-turn-helix domain-containing protein [candidate division WOR-3 bacterium]
MRAKMNETDYRASRVCRVLGNPTAYQIVRLLLDGVKRTPGQISEEIGISLPLVSMTLRTLRNVDIVRYITARKNKFYWIKDNTIFDIWNSLSKFVSRMRERDW